MADGSGGRGGVLAWLKALLAAKPGIRRDPHGAPPAELRSLDLSNQDLCGEIPGDWARLTQLQEFHLSGNDFIEVPSNAFSGMSLLKQLHIDGCSIEIPKSLCELKCLEILSLRENEIVFLPPEIGKLQSLKYLDVGVNELISIPPEICDLKKLKHLVLDENYIRSLPLEFGHLFQRNSGLNISFRSNNWNKQLQHEIKKAIAAQIVQLEEDKKIRFIDSRLRSRVNHKHSELQVITQHYVRLAASQDALLRDFGSIPNSILEGILSMMDLGIQNALEEENRQKSKLIDEQYDMPSIRRRRKW